MKHRVLDHGYIKLHDFMGGDRRVIQSARVSYDKFWASWRKKKDPQLICYLMEHRHGTPFESSVFTFEVKCPIFVQRQWRTHRMASYTEKSLRYVKAKPDFYVPEELLRCEVGKGMFEPMDKESSAAVAEFMKANQSAWDSYQDILTLGVAKELARIVLPFSLYTTFLFTVNARSLMNFIELRNAPKAMQEMKEYAILIEEIFEGKMPVTHEAFVAYGRRAP